MTLLHTNFLCLDVFLHWRYRKTCNKRFPPPHLLCISTSERVLLTLFAGWNQWTLKQHFPSLTKENKKRKEIHAYSMFFCNFFASFYTFYNWKGCKKLFLHDQQMACGARVRWSKYTTPTYQRFMAQNCNCKITKL